MPNQLAEQQKESKRALNGFAKERKKKHKGARKQKKKKNRKKKRNQSFISIIVMIRKMNQDYRNRLVCLSTIILTQIILRTSS
jgi:hypothetical protein